MKRSLCFILMLIGVFCLTSCEPDGNEDYPTQLNSYLTEGVDYIDHAMTLDPVTKVLEYDKTAWYENNLRDVPLPDPHVYYEDGVYYITGTADRNANGIYIDVYTTTDFITYTAHYDVYKYQTFNGWENDTKPSLFAPEIYKFDGKYYMYYSAKDELSTPIRRNSVVVADSPIGPYRPIQQNGVDGLSKPVFEDPNSQRFDVLDVTIFQDDDNKLYMYYSVYDTDNGYQKIVGVELTSPYQADWNTYANNLIIPGSLKSGSAMFKPLTWETLRSPNIVEAPFVIKSDNGKYYLTYSVNGCWNKYYNVCYAVSDSPLGTYTKPAEIDPSTRVAKKSWSNLLLGYPGDSSKNSDVYDQWSGFASGTGHHCFFNIGDQIMIGYHAHQNRDHNYDIQKWEERYFAFDYLYFDEEGTPFVNGPTWSPQPLPEELSGYANVAYGATVKVKNVTNAKAINDNYIVDCYNLKQEEGKEVVLGEGYSFIEIEFDKEYTITGIAIYNSSFYESAVLNIKYIDFGNGNAIYCPEFASKFYNEDKEFVFPGSAFTFEMLKEIKTNKVIICFELPEGGQINEIKVLGY